MSYGLKITNATGGLVIDSQFESMSMKNETPNIAAPGSVFPPPDATYSDLIAVKPTAPNVNTSVFKEGDRTFGDYYLYWNPDAVSYSYYVLERFSEVAPSVSAYGLEVFGPSNELYFSSDYLETQGFTVVTTGLLTNTTPIYYPSETGAVDELHKYYCVINSTTYFASRFFGGVSYYSYIYTATNQGRIKITKSTYAQNLSYMIIKEKI